MSRKKTDGKRHRSSNISYNEKEFLLKIALEKNIYILKNKHSNSSSWKDENSRWLDITKMFTLKS